jgi:hypothetical protein
LQPKPEILGTTKGHRAAPGMSLPEQAGRMSAAVGLTQEEIGPFSKCRSRCRSSNEAVGKCLWMQAVEGPKKDWTKAAPAAGISWSKTRARWKEPPAEHPFSGPGGTQIQSEVVTAHHFFAGEIARRVARANRAAIRVRLADWQAAVGTESDRQDDAQSLLRPNAVLLSPT